MEETTSVELAKSGVKRPMNAFLIFCKRHRGLVREKNPNVDNRAVTRILGDLWTNLDLNEKLTYTNLAKQYKDAFLKENPTYKWYNPVKHTRHVAVSKSVAALPASTAYTSTNSTAGTDAFSFEQTSTGKLADKTVVGGLNLLLMAGQHTTSPLLTIADNTKHSAAVSQDRCMQQPHQVMHQHLLYMSQSESNRHLSHMVEVPVDLSQSASNFKSASIASVNVSPGCYPSSHSVSDAGNTLDASVRCSTTLASSHASQNSMTFATVCGSNPEGRDTLVHNLPHGVFAVASSSSINQGSISRDVLCSTGCGPVNYSAVVKCDTSPTYSSCMTAAQRSSCENNNAVQYPKTKKQKAVDCKTSSTVVPTSPPTSLSLPIVDGKVSEYEALTLGQIQDRLITKVVESGSLCDERQHIIGTKEHLAARISTGKLPSGWFSHSETSQAQTRTCVVLERASSEQFSSGISPLTSVSLFPAKQQSIVTTTQEPASVSSAAMSSVAARLLLQAATVPLISPLDVNMLIERELTKTTASSSVVTAGTGSLSRQCLTTDKGSCVPNTVAHVNASESVVKRYFPSIPVLCGVVGEGIGSCGRKPSVNCLAGSSLHRQQSNNMLCPVKPSSTGQQHLDHAVTVKQSDDIAAEYGSDLSLNYTAECTKTSSADGHIQLPCKSSMTLAGLCKNNLSSVEINNNCRRGYAGTVRSQKVNNSLKVGRSSAVRKSKRCNRGRRYQELMSQGVFQHHTSRKRSESSTQLETSGDGDEVGCSKAASTCLDSDITSVGLQERCKRFKSCDDMQPSSVPSSQYPDCSFDVKPMAPPHSEKSLRCEAPHRDCTQWINICELRRATGVVRQSQTHRRRKPSKSSVIHLRPPSHLEQLHESVLNSDSQSAHISDKTSTPPAC